MKLSSHGGPSLARSLLHWAPAALFSISLMASSAALAAEADQVNMVGIWDVVDPTTSKTVSQFEFKSDHSYVETKSYGGGSQTTPGQWRFEDSILRFEYDHGRRVDDLEHGRITKRTDDLLEYRPSGGVLMQRKKGKVYHFQRQ